MLITQNGEAKPVVMDVHSCEQQQRTLALIKLLALGNKDIEQDAVRSAEEVFAELDKDDCCLIR
jgi:hypothetical protein